VDEIILIVGPVPLPFYKAALRAILEETRSAEADESVPR